jgi:hypothetical protein
MVSPTTELLGTAGAGEAEGSALMMVVSFVRLVEAWNTAPLGSIRTAYKKLHRHCFPLHN